MKELALRSRPAGGGFKPPRAALAEDRRGERSRKRHPMRCQVGIRKTSASESLLTCRNKDRWHQNRGVGSCAPGWAWRVPVDWPGGVRHGGDVSLICCSRTEREKARHRHERPRVAAGETGCSPGCGVRRRTGP